MVGRADRWLFVASAIAGGGLWLAFDALKLEPWDTPYGVLAILGLGFLLGFLGPRHPFAWPLGMLAGEILFGFATLFRTSGGANLFLPLGLVYLVPFTLPALFGSFAGAALAQRHRA